ncbi:hypothetical protein HDU85_006862 [Gaertneriomyces sp. JEL0708]|nr:hypothetical protein HDU85_006862 [Gaertneriomyces sp. JEL0708]
MNSTNNTILFAEMGDATPRKATIATGHYNAFNIGQAVAAAMSNAGTQAYTCTYDEKTRRLRIETTGSKEFKLIEGKRGSTAYLQLGMSKDAESGYALPGFTLPAPLNLSASQPILLTSRTLQASNGITYVAGINSDMNVLACITPDSFNDVVSWTNPSDNMFQTGEISMSSIDIQLFDSQTMREIRTTAPIVVVLGVYDDPADLL